MIRKFIALLKTQYVEFQRTYLIIAYTANMIVSRLLTKTEETREKIWRGTEQGREARERIAKGLF